MKLLHTATALLLTLPTFAVGSGQTITRPPADATLQTVTTPPSPAQEVHHGTDHRPASFRLLYTVTELDGGKRVGVQHFSMVVTNDPSAPSGEVRLGSKVPFVAGLNMQATYLDVGLNINARIVDHPEGEFVQTSVEQSSVAESSPDIKQPIIRQARLNSSSLLPPGKPVVLGSLDIPGSTRHLDIEVVLEPVR